MAAANEAEVAAGWNLYRRGDNAGAERCCQKVLSGAPAHAGALGLLGLLRLGAGRADEAAAMLTQALKRKPRDGVLLGGLGLAHLMRGNAADAEQALRAALKWGNRDDAMLHMRLGMALGAQGRTADAITELRRALAMAPDHPDILLNLANAVGQTGDGAEAEKLLRRLLTRLPQHGDARFNLGTLYTRLARLDEAVAEFRTLLGYFPGNADAHNSLGIALERQSNLDQAEQAYRQALALNDRHLAALNNLGNVLRTQVRLDEAATCYQRAMELAPAHADGFLNMGMLRAGQDRLEEACELFRKVLSIDPRCVEAAINLSLAGRDRGRPDEAIAASRQAVAIAPHSVDARRQLAHALLWAGHLREGWAERERRLRESPGMDRFAPLPQWCGERDAGIRLLLWNEQAIGEDILYLELIAELARDGVDVTLETDPRIAAMIARSIPGIRVAPRAEPPEIDRTRHTHQSTVASMARYLRPDFASFPQQITHLLPDQARAQSIRARTLGESARFLVGLSWWSANKEVGSDKSIDLLECTDLFNVPGVAYLNLQYGDMRHRLQECARVTGQVITDCEDIDLYADLEGLAASCAACDLVISVSGVAAHMAGAVGVPVWLLAPKSRVRFWFWFHDKTTSPWYPSMRVFDQHKLHDWSGVLAEAGRELRHLVAAK